jgi:hypothetical protein
VTRTDRAIGILLGVVLGIAIVVVFVFFGSEGTIDAPRISHGSTTSTAPARHKPKPKPKPHGPKTVTADVPIAGGAPPTSGPAQVDAHQNDRVKLQVSSDASIGVELLGYDISTTLEAGKPSTISFKATKTGNFPLIVSASHIAVAQIRVAGPR